MTHSSYEWEASSLLCDDKRAISNAIEKRYVGVFSILKVKKKLVETSFEKGNWGYVDYFEPKFKTMTFYFFKAGA